MVFRSFRLSANAIVDAHAGVGATAPAADASAALQPAPSDTAAAQDAAAAERAIDAERLRLIARQTARAPLGVAVAAGFVAAMMAPHAGAGLAWGWAAVAIGLWVARALVCRALLARPPAPEHVRAWIRRLVAAATLSGAVAGSSALWFFGAPPLEWALMTMVLCAWSAGGIAVSAAVPAAFYGLATAFLAPLALGWLVSAMPLRLPVAGMIVLFLGYLLLFARDGAALVARALRVGFENEQLARQLRQREAEARSARERAEEASLAKSRFLAAASHDLRQPLHSLLLLLDHARRSTQEPHVAGALEQAARSADSLRELFGALLDLSRLDAGSLVPEPRPLPLARLLERLANDHRPRAEGKGLAFSCATTAAWVRSDPVMLDRILRNLLDNAIKYTERGFVALEVAGEGARDGAGGKDDTRSVRIAVRDSGVGIAAQDVGRIFEEYFRGGGAASEHGNGLGLGLAIVRRLADALGHRLELHSTPGGGSTFALTLERCAQPAAAMAEGAAPRPERAPPDALRGLVVVVVEDDAEVAGAMRALLADWGCHVVVAADGAAAVAALDAAGQRPDAILADWRLAGAENGLRAIEQLHARFGARPAALVTGEIDPAAIDVPPRLAVTVMQKPLRADELATWLLWTRSIG